MTFLTTRTGLVGDAARMSGYAVVSLFKGLSTLEKRFEVRALRFCHSPWVWIMVCVHRDAYMSMYIYTTTK